MGIETAIAGALIPAAVGGVSNLASTAMTNDANADLASSANQTSIELANTAHQREVNDLRAAGLNPILSAGGSGSSVPTMHVATMENPGKGLQDAMAQGITNFSALQSSKQYDPLVDKMRSEASLNNALSAKAAADTTSALASTRLTEENIRKARSGVLGVTLGTDLGSKTSGFLNHATDTISSKLKSIISDITTSSAKKVSAPPPKSNKREVWTRDFDGVEHIKWE